MFIATRTDGSTVKVSTYGVLDMMYRNGEVVSARPAGTVKIDDDGHDAWNDDRAERGAMPRRMR